MKNMKKIIISCLSLILLICNAYGSLNAMSYTYDFWKNIIPSTEGLAYRETYYSNSITDPPQSPGRSSKAGCPAPGPPGHTLRIKTSSAHP